MRRLLEHKVHSRLQPVSRSSTAPVHPYLMSITWRQFWVGLGIEGITHCARTFKVHLPRPSYQLLWSNSDLTLHTNRSREDKVPQSRQPFAFLAIKHGPESDSVRCQRGTEIVESSRLSEEWICLYVVDSSRSSVIHRWSWFPHAAANPVRWLVGVQRFRN